jgi:hypothetical protein
MATQFRERRAPYDPWIATSLPLAMTIPFERGER